MQTSTNNVLSIINNVRNRYFTHQLIKGITHFIIAVIISFAVLILVDLAFALSSNVLLILKIVYSSFLILLCVFYLFQPLFFWFIHQGKYNDIWFARQIGISIPEVDDKLINILQLQNFKEQSDLVNAGIQQKLLKIDVQKLKSLYSLRDLYRLFFVLLFVLFGSFIITILIPDAIHYSGSRILPFYKASDKSYYSIIIENENLDVKKGSNYILVVSIEGKFRPDELYIRFGSSNYLMRDSSGLFTYKFLNVRQNLSFQINTQEYLSEIFQLKCIPVPTIQNINLIISPPVYTHFSQSILENRGNASVPYGSQVSWEIQVLDSDSLYFILNDSTKYHISQIQNKYIFKKQLFSDFKYSLIPINRLNSDLDTFNFEIQVEPDLYPELTLNKQIVDEMGKFTFAGIIGDDYGIYKFQLVLNNDNSSVKIPLPFDVNALKQSFFYEGQLKDFVDSLSGNYVELYLEVFDNDAFYPNKSTKSNTLYGAVPNDKKLSEIEQKKLGEVKDKLNFGKEILKQLQKEKQNIKNKLLSEDLSQWEKNQLVDNLKNVISEMQQVSEQINQIREDLKQLPDHSMSEELLEKRDMLNELLSQLMDEELAKMLDELRELQEKLSDKNNPKDIDDIDFSLDDMEKQLDRNLEMLKRYDVEKDMENLVKDLKELSEEFSQADSLTNQNTVDSLFNQLQNQLEKHDEVLQKNMELESPLDLDSFDEQKQNTSEKSKKFKDGKKSDEDNPADDIDSLADDIEQNMESAMQEENAESAELIRELLENILLYSFEQESLIKQFQTIERPDNDLKRNQIQLNERFSVIEDSLQMLMMRNVQLASFVGGQLKDINFNFSKIAQTFSLDVYKSVNVNQQSIMKSVNDLVLMLQESLKNMNNSSSGKGGNCNKSGKNKKPGMGAMKKQQESFKKSLQDMIDGLKNGEKGAKGKQGMSQQLSKMLSEQEKMQQMLQQLMQSGQVGQQTNEVLKEIGKLLDKNIDDIIRRNISDQMLNRQQSILNRMLEAEKAEQERDKDDKREAEKPNNFKISNPKDDLEYKEKINKQKGLIVRPNVPLKYFFQRKYDMYINNMENH